MSKVVQFIRCKVQEKKVKKLAKKSGVVRDQLPACLKDPHNTTLVLRQIKTEKEMPALLFDWNIAGFNVRGQTPAAIVASLIASGAVDYGNLGTLFTFRDGDHIGQWTLNVRTNLPWARHQPGVADVCNYVVRINKISDHSRTVDLENFTHVFA
ncbi:6223_t:CDS:2 [Paraglomus occultum]|uniref:6223_t:CDS:1 n=1 Tax=Paraglomus occultum TaxID=144539 RepID=A0A9N9GA68_9GLOM|nr:6223_t:CDS:2 [Paraglomus occultum]